MRDIKLPPRGRRELRISGLGYYTANSGNSSQGIAAQ